MSDELKKLERQLEEATTADCGPGAPLDAETELLRETWLAFGELLDTAYPPGDEPIKMPPTPRREFRGRWLAAAALAAASLLIGVTAVWNSIESNRNQIVKPIENNQQEIEPEQVERAPETMVADADLQWDDTIDDQIALAGQSVVQIQQDWYQLSEPFDSLEEGAVNIEEDMDESTL